MVKLFGRTLVGAHGGNVKQHEATERDMLRVGESLERGRNRNRRCLGYRISIRARRNCGKCQRGESVLVCQSHRLAVTACQSSGLAVLTAAIDWPDGMDDVFRREPSAASDYGLSRRQCPDL